MKMIENLRRLTSGWINKIKMTFRMGTAFLRKDPDFLIIGVQKGGTSSLYHYLTQHPDIAACHHKEIHYFDLNFHKGQWWYRKFFPLRNFSSKKTGEATPYYIFHPLAPQRIHNSLPNVKLIVLLRDPVSRAFSHYQMQVSKGREDQPFEAAISKEKDLIDREIQKINEDPNYQSPVHQHFSYLSRGRYVEQLATWLHYFPKKQILLLQSEAFFKEPEQTLQRVYTFLEIRPYLPDDLTPKNVGTYDWQLSEKTRKYLIEHFRRHNQELPEFTNQSFDWFSKKSGKLH